MQGVAPKESAALFHGFAMAPGVLLLRKPQTRVHDAWKRQPWKRPIVNPAPKASG